MELFFDLRKDFALPIIPIAHESPMAGPFYKLFVNHEEQTFDDYSYDGQDESFNDSGRFRLSFIDLEGRKKRIALSPELQQGFRSYLAISPQERAEHSCHQLYFHLTQLSWDADLKGFDHSPPVRSGEIVLLGHRTNFFGWKKVHSVVHGLMYLSHGYYLHKLGDSGPLVISTIEPAKQIYFYVKSHFKPVFKNKKP